MQHQRINRGDESRIETVIFRLINRARGLIPSALLARLLRDGADLVDELDRHQGEPPNQD